MEKQQQDLPKISNNLEVLKRDKEFLDRRLQGFKFTWWIALSWLVAGGLLGYAFVVWKHGENINSYVAIPYIIFGAIVSIFLYSYFAFIVRTFAIGRLRRIEMKIAELGRDELKETIEDNFFTKLVQINFKYLDQYYLQTQEQADKSFRLSTFASLSGFLLIVTGILILYFQQTDKVAGYVTTTSGILSEFIAAVFFYLYNQTVLKMSQYHQKLVLTQNISLALKITDEMDSDTKNKALETLIDRLTTDVNKYLSDNKE